MPLATFIARSISKLPSEIDHRGHNDHKEDDAQPQQKVKERIDLFGEARSLLGKPKRFILICEQRYHQVVEEHSTI